MSIYPLFYFCRDQLIKLLQFVFLFEYQVKFKIASCHCAINENRAALAEVSDYYSHPISYCWLLLFFFWGHKSIVISMCLFSKVFIDFFTPFILFFLLNLISLAPVVVIEMGKSYIKNQTSLLVKTQVFLMYAHNNITIACVNPENSNAIDEVKLVFMCMHTR